MGLPFRMILILNVIREIKIEIKIRTCVSSNKANSLRRYACAYARYALLLARPQRFNKATEPGRQTEGPKRPTAADQALLP